MIDDQVGKVTFLLTQLFLWWVLRLDSFSFFLIFFFFCLFFFFFCVAKVGEERRGGRERGREKGRERGRSGLVFPIGSAVEHGIASSFQWGSVKWLFAFLSWLICKHRHIPHPHRMDTLQLSTMIKIRSDIMCWFLYKCNILLEQHLLWFNKDPLYQWNLAALSLLHLFLLKIINIRRNSMIHQDQDNCSKPKCQSNRIQLTIQYHIVTPCLWMVVYVWRWWWRYVCV